MTINEQLERWVAGESVHNDDRSECCPDFSCCLPLIRTPLEERERFRDSGEEERMSMLITFMGRMLALELPAKSIHIAGRNET